MNRASIILVLGVLILFLLVGGYYAFRQQTGAAVSPQPDNSSQSTTPTTQTAPGGAPTTEPAVTAVEVDLTDQGFSPATVTIKKGQTVHFVNKSSNQMWIASNPHPVHTDYPGFDELKTADTYDFTFDKVGTWGYHDHLSPSTMGTVVVTQ